MCYMTQEKKTRKTTAKSKTPVRKTGAKISVQRAKTVKQKNNRAVVALPNVIAKSKTPAPKKSAVGKMTRQKKRALQAAAPQLKKEKAKNQTAENRKIVNKKTALAEGAKKVKFAAPQSTPLLASARKVKPATAKAVKFPAPVKTAETKIVKSNKPEIKKLKKSFQKIDAPTSLKKARRTGAKNAPVASAIKRRAKTETAKIEKIKIEKVKNQKLEIKKRQILAAPLIKTVRQKSQKTARTKLVAAEKNNLVNNKKTPVAKVKLKTEKAKISVPVEKAQLAKIKIAKTDSAKTVKSDLAKAARKNSVKNKSVVVKKVKSQNMSVKKTVAAKTARRKNLETAKSKIQKKTPKVFVKKVKTNKNEIEIMPPVAVVKPRKKKAKAISSAVFRGRKARYDFQVFPLDSEFDAAISAIYVISKRKTDRNKRAHHALVCIGQTDSLSGEIKRHAKKCIKKHAANVISILPETNEKRRLKIEEDLKAAHSIACGAAAS